MRVWTPLTTSSSPHKHRGICWTRQTRWPRPRALRKVPFPVVTGPCVPVSWGSPPVVEFATSPRTRVSSCRMYQRSATDHDHTRRCSQCPCCSQCSWCSNCCCCRCCHYHRCMCRCWFCCLYCVDAVAAFEIDEQCVWYCSLVVCLSCLHFGWWGRCDGTGFCLAQLHAWFLGLPNLRPWW